MCGKPGDGGNPGDGAKPGRGQTRRWAGNPGMGVIPEMCGKPVDGGKPGGGRKIPVVGGKKEGREAALPKWWSTT